MSADVARKQRRKAAAKNRENGSLQSVAEARAATMGDRDMPTGRLQCVADAEAAAIGGMITRRFRSAAGGEGAMTTEATVAVEVAAEAAMRERNAGGDGGGNNS